MTGGQAVYLGWAEQLAHEHVEAMGFGRGWSRRQGGTWVVRRHGVTYFHPALLDERLELSTHVEGIRGARGLRRLEVRRASDGALLAEVRTEWAWIRPDGRPARVPQDLVDAFTRPSGASG